MGFTTADYIILAATAASTATAALTKPSAPRMPAPPPMPDQASIDQSQQQQEALALQRTGRQSTILTDNATTGDKLGP